MHHRQPFLTLGVEGAERGFQSLVRLQGPLAFTFGPHGAVRDFRFLGDRMEPGGTSNFL